MAIDERSRHGLYLKLEQVLGPEEATTLMEHLPPIGWADVATKHDLEQLRVATKQEIQVVRQEVQSVKHELMACFRGELMAMHGELMAVQRHMVFAMTGSMVSVAALAFSAAQFI